MENLNFSEANLGKLYKESETTAEASFYTSGVDSAVLVCNIIDGEAVPDKVRFTVKEKSVGTKINVEVVENGFIIKIDSKTRVAESEWDMKQVIEKAIVIENIESFDYDEDMHKFKNLSETLQEFEAALI